MARQTNRKPRAEVVRKRQSRRGRQPRTFADLGLPQILVGTLAEAGIHEPFPIQAATIPDALAGRDLLGRGQTGSGKTLAYALPLLVRLMRGRRPGKVPRAVVLGPTRELAAQITDVIAPLARQVKLSTVLVAGGMSYTPQLRAMARGVDIVVATPGRLLDLIDRGAADLGQVQVGVLDEADQMCDLGFHDEVTAILDRMPPDCQHLLFSATLDDQVAGLAERYLRDPVQHGVDPGELSVRTMEHHIWNVHPIDRPEILTQLAHGAGRTLVFVRTQLDADRVAADLRARGVLAGALHGGLRQAARTRVMDAFKRGALPVLVATDVAARGIHVDDVSLVIQADVPHDAKDYLHRAGRTARAGEAGRVITTVAPRQRRRMDAIARQIGLGVRALRVRPGDEVIGDLGGVCPVGLDPIDQASYEAIVAPRPDQRRSGRRPRAHRMDRRDRNEGHRRGRN